MSLYFLVMIVGILGGVFMLVVIFSLLSLAQKADTYLDHMGLGEAGDCLKSPNLDERIAGPRARQDCEV